MVILPADSGAARAALSTLSSSSKLLPDLLNGFLATGFAEANKNRLVAAARDHAEAQARNLIGDLQSDVNQSAKSTLEAIAKGFAALQVSFEFDGSPTVDLNVGMASDVAA